MGNSSGSFGSQRNQASQDVFLTKYDSAGQVRWTRLLGSADTAAAYALKVDPTGGVVVATDAEEVRVLCESLGAPVVMTDPTHPSGTDRVAEVAARPEYHEVPVIVNVQGDEPLVKEDHLRSAVSLVFGGWDVGTCATPVGDAEARSDPAVVKVARPG